MELFYVVCRVSKGKRVRRALGTIVQCEADSMGRPAFVLAGDFARQYWQENGFEFHEILRVERMKGEFVIPAGAR